MYLNGASTHLHLSVLRVTEALLPQWRSRIIILFACEHGHCEVPSISVQSTNTSVPFA